MWRMREVAMNKAGTGVHVSIRRQAEYTLYIFVFFRISRGVLWLNRCLVNIPYRQGKPG